MSGRELLYYPTIVVPRNSLQWGLLYWDKVRSIVPSGYDPKKMNPLKEVTSGDKQINNLIQEKNSILENNFKMMKLMEEYGYYEEIVPEGSFEDVFEELEIIINNNFIPTPSWKTWSFDNIHISKMNRDIINLLKQHDLITESNLGSEWYRVENKISILYMSLLARYFSDTSTNYTVPYTDSRRAELLTYRFEKYNNLIGTKDVFISVNFQNLLPIPSKEISLFDIIKFRNKNEEELMTLRKVLNDYQTELKNVKSQSDLNHVNVKYEEKMELEKNNLINLFEENDWSFITSSFKSLVGVLEQPIADTLNNQSPTLNGIRLGLATVQIGCEIVRRRLKRRNIIKNSPYAYLYKAEKAAII
ncbi:MAG: DUF6236 family protein [Candidatus Heimdallarchaeaceae archaeon]